MTLYKLTAIFSTLYMIITFTYMQSGSDANHLMEGSNTFGNVIVSALHLSG